MGNEDRQRIEQLIEFNKIDEHTSPVEVRSMLRSVIGDRGVIIYLIWKVLRERHPEIDATGLLGEACRQFGEMKGKNFGEADTPGEWLEKFVSRPGLLAWDMEFHELNDEKAVAVFHHCPHMAAARAVGATDEEVAHLCRSIMIQADYAKADLFPHLELTFPGKTCGEGGKCTLTITKKDKA